MPSNETYDDASFEERMLFHVYLCLFCFLILIFGIFGNISVLYIYSRRLNVRIFGFFVKVLAVFDLITTCGAMPCIFVFRLVPYRINTRLMCKALTFMQHFSAMNSGIIFIIIAVQRFRKVCRPNKGQISEGLAKKLIFLSVLLSASGSTPIVFFLVEHNVTVEWNRMNLTVPICDFSSNFKEGITATLYALWVSFELVAISATLIGLYIVIAKTMKTHSRNRSRSFKHSSGRGCERKQTSTIIFFVLTVIFLITSSPIVISSIYFSLVTVDTEWTYAAITAFDLCVDLLFTNCVVNPFVYSFISAVFRRECKAVLRTLTARRQRRSADDSQLQTSQQNGTTANDVFTSTTS